MNSWFEVDKEGLQKILAKRGKSFAIFELIQNAWDTDAKNIEITAETVGKGLVALSIKDNDPTGFKDLSHAFTLFAPSEKLDNPEKRGRFNIGEKLVLSICKSAMLETTTGTVLFNENGTRTVSKKGRDRGSVFMALLRMTVPEREGLADGIKRLIVPTGKTLTYNGKVIPHRESIASFEALLPTVAANKDGEMIRTVRKTTVNVYSRHHNSSIYEMGIPVVDTDDLYDVDIQQKVPVSMSRDNVPPGYLQKLRALVLNETSKLLGEEDVNDTWVRDALDHKDVANEAVEDVITKRFGEKRVIFDPSDLEANHLATAKGYTVIPPRALSKASWSNVREAGAAMPAGRVTPSPKPFSEDGKPLKYVENLTPEMIAFCSYAKRIAKLVGCGSITVKIADDARWKHRAAYGSGMLIVNLAGLTDAWFQKPHESMVELLIHEFAHHYESNHLSSNYNDVLCRLGTILVFADSEVTSY